MNRDKREITSSVTHLTAAAFALLGTVCLTVKAARCGGASRIASVLVFGISMVGLYSISTVYHWIDAAKTRAKQTMQRVDHMLSLC